MPDMRIHRLQLHYFRNHAETSIDVGGCSVVFIGHNGAGKTNILEALSLLSPGRGFRQSTLREMTHISHTDKGWVIAAYMQATDGEQHIGTALDIDSGMDKRVVKVDGQRLKAQADLCRHLAVAWQTPQMDGLLLESNSVRRKYLDRMVYQFDAEHATRVNAYEQAMRERNRLLKQGSRDDAWLSVLEQQMAERTAAIAAARNQAVERMHQAMQASTSGFPVAHITLEGEAEQALAQGMPAADYEQKLSATLAERRFIDAQAGRATRGAHRTFLQVWFGGKQGLEAAHCSTGEQKALLLSLLLAQARARVQWHQSPPILLLDEVVAHLDECRRHDLFSEIESLGAQAFMTGTDAADFSGSQAHQITIAHGLISEMAA